MEMIQQLLADSLNGFSLRYLPLFLFQLLVAGLLGHLLQRIMNRKFAGVIVMHGALLAVSIALITGIVKYSLPFAVIGAALVLILARSREHSQLQLIGLFLIGLVGVGCGVGSVFLTVVGFVLISAILLFTPVSNK